MATYSTILQRPLDTISFEDDDFMEELIWVEQLFRTFSIAIEEFIKERGYSGDLADVDAKVAFIRGTFENTNMTPPREIREWFTAEQSVKRDTVFRLCFAFGLDGNGTDDFFRRFYTRERSFNCHQLQETIYYFCMNNGLPYVDALDIQNRVPLIGERQSGEAVFTGSIISDLNDLESKVEQNEYRLERRLSPKESLILKAIYIGDAL